MFSYLPSKGNNIDNNGSISGNSNHNNNNNNGNSNNSSNDGLLLSLLVSDSSNTGAVGKRLLSGLEISLIFLEVVEATGLLLMQVSWVSQSAAVVVVVVVAAVAAHISYGYRY